jgi:hypothetical protein
MSLLRALEHLAPGRCGPGILGALTEHVFKDRDAEVVTQALGVVMACPQNVYQSL